MNCLITHVHQDINDRNSKESQKFNNKKKKDTLDKQIIELELKLKELKEIKDDICLESDKHDFTELIRNNITIAYICNNCNNVYHKRINKN